MSFERPTLTQLVERARTDVDARLPGADSRLRRSMLGVVASVQAGVAHGLYGYLDYLARQILPDTSDSEYLERRAATYGIARKAATVAVGVANFTGETGYSIPLGTVLQRAGGAEYVTTAEAAITGGVATAPIAAAQAGVAGAAPAGAKLVAVSPVVGVSSIAFVAGGGVTGGADEESDDQLRGRLLARISEAPAGGAEHDYFNWALEVAEVTRAWVFEEWMGAGSVGVAFMMDGREVPTPTEDDVEAVRAYLVDRAPVPARNGLYVFAPTVVPQAIEISGLDPDNAEVRAAVEAEIDDLFYRTAEPGGTVLVSQLREAISQAAGESDHVLISPVANIVLGAGQIAVRGAIVWSA